VKQEFGGRGIAKRLVLAVIEEARKQNKKINPICSYAKKMMESSDEYKDVLNQ
jgi:predicted GNAT family acetyltransferase